MTNMQTLTAIIYFYVFLLNKILTTCQAPITSQARCPLPDTELVNGRARARRSGCAVPVHLPAALSDRAPPPTPAGLLPPCCLAVHLSAFPQVPCCLIALGVLLNAALDPTLENECSALGRSGSFPLSLRSSVDCTAPRKPLRSPPPPKLESGALARVPESTLYFSSLNLGTYLPKV